MAYKKHPRHTTNQQFSKKTTVDGSRIDTGLDEMVDHFNQIPRGDIKTRFTPQTFVMGWSPQDPAAASGAGMLAAVTSKFPWMKALNEDNDVASNSATPAKTQNRQRMKGYAVPGIFSDRRENTTATSWLKNGMQYIWTTSLHFKNPVIIDSLYLLMTVDGASAALKPYDAEWLWPGTLTTPDLPPGITAGDNAKDLSLSLHVDHMYKPEDRGLNAVEIMKRDFQIPPQAVRNLTSAPTSDMTPAYPGAEIAGHFSKIRVNSPIPELSRVRLSVNIPDYTASRFGGASKYPWKTNPWFRQCFHVAMVVLEEIQ